MILFDTSFLYAFCRKKDVHHQKALAISKDPRFKDPHIPEEVLQELVTIITSRDSSEEAMRVGNAILKNQTHLKIIEPNRQHFERTWETFQKLSPHTLSYVDCLLITLAKELECEVLTFDEKLKKALAQI